MLYPVPAVLVSVADSAGNDNLITIAWTGTVCSDPAMTYISVRKERYSHHMLKENKEFVINLVSKEICRAADFCGVRSGCDLDKFEATGLTREKASTVNVPLVKESPVNIECKVTQVLELGSHDMFLAKVTAVQVDESLLDEKGKLDLNKAQGFIEGKDVNGTLSFNLHVGADSDTNNKISVNIDSMSATGIGVKDLKVSTEDDATAAIDRISEAISKVSSQRSSLGAVQNRLEHTINNLDNVSENTTSAESRIRDTDMASEMVNYSKNNILAQAGQSMLAQANQSNQGVLSLLQ